MYTKSLSALEEILCTHYLVIVKIKSDFLSHFGGFPHLFFCYLLFTIILELPC